jgi:hypothetical protein
MIRDGEYHIWPWRDLRIYYRPELDGAGSRLAEHFINFIRQRSTQQFSRAYEWCAGPAFIGFALLAEGICRNLCVSDINPSAMECVERTIAANRLSGVTHYVSDNLQSVPSTETFDLVVSNPPNFYALNPRHYLGGILKDDLRPNDPGWEIHRRFYAQIGPYLQPGAALYISEVEPHSDRVFLPRTMAEPYDIRPRPAIDDFLPLIADARLEYVNTELYFTGRDGAELFMMTSRNTGSRSGA